MASTYGGIGPSNAAARQRRDWREWGLVLGATAVLLAVAAPVIWNGAPLADEYHLCLRPQHEGGYGSYLSDIWADTGVVRPARFIELILVSGLCDRVPFWAIIVVPLVIKLAGAPLLWGLLRDLRLSAPWPAVGAALWLLEPLGTEAALWPAALHVNLGLVFALAALRLHVRGRFGLGAAAVLGACLSVEQVIFALPLAAWLVTPREHRREATVVTAGVCVAVLVAYVLWPGENPRQDVTLDQRVRNVIADPLWYVRFPVVGLGLHSGFMGFLWAFPWSLALVAATVGAGWRYGPDLLAAEEADSGPAGGRVWTTAVPVVVLLGLVNLPLIVTEVGQSARTFTPSWLVIAALVPIVASRLPAARHQVIGTLFGAFVGFAVLSLALSAWVRVQTAAFNEAALTWIAEQTSDGDVVAVCDVPRTAVEPSPAGAFHLHTFHSEYSGPLEYHTGRIAELRRSGQKYWGQRCPDLTGADLIVDFDELQAMAGAR